MTHCWNDELSQFEKTNDSLAPDYWHKWAEIFSRGGATCMLPDGHDGPCEFVPDSQIGVTFVDTDTTAASEG